MLQIHKHYSELEKPVGNKHYSLFGLFVSYKEKSVVKMPWSTRSLEKNLNETLKAAPFGKTLTIKPGILVCIKKSLFKVSLISVIGISSLIQSK